MSTAFKNLANPDYCPSRLRREFLKLHASFPIQERPEIPPFQQNDSSKFLAHLYKHTDGIIFGEEHFDNANAAFLAEHIEYMAGLGVTTLFFEGLFHGLERGIDGARDERDSVHDEYRTMIEAAKKHGMNIVGIDAKGCKRGEGATRDIFMNAYAQSIINNLPDRGKWVALVGMMHLNDSIFIDPASFERHLVRGLAELTGGVSIIIDEAENRYIKADAEFLAAPAKIVRSDFVIGIPAYKKSIFKGATNAIAELENNLSDAGWHLTHYDIDSFAAKNGDKFIKAITFAIKMNSRNLAELESLKYKIKSGFNGAFLDIYIDEKRHEMVFCCDFEEVGKLVQLFEKRIKERDSAHSLS